MTRFVNTALIGLIAFLVLLGAFGYAGTFTPKDGPTGSTPMLGNVTVRWDGTRVPAGLVVQIPLRNGGAEPAQVAGVAYTASLEGRVLAQGVADPPTVVPPGSHGMVEIAIDLPPDFLDAWWSAAVASGRPATLRIAGAVSVDSAHGASVLPFAWTSTSQDGLAVVVAEALATCGTGNDVVCLKGSSAAWSNGDLAVTLRLHSASNRTTTVANGTLRLRLHEITVASGTFGGTTLQPFDDAEAQVTLRFAHPALASWWPSHARACESSPARLEVGLDLDQSAPASRQAVAWTLPGKNYATHLVCGAQP